MQDLIYKHKQGLETAIRTMTGLWHINVVFEGTKAYTDGSTIVLPNVDVFAATDLIDDDDIENARAYFLALRGYAWHEAAHTVETDFTRLTSFRKSHGSFAASLHNALDDIRIEERFGKNSPGIKEAMEYLRELWVWPRFVRRKERGDSINLLSEVLIGLQVLMKHYDKRDEHSFWQAMEPEATSFVERNIDDLDSAHDTLKMDKTDGTQRLCEIVERMLGRWKQEFETVLPLCAKLPPKPESDIEVKPERKEEPTNALDQLETNGVPPLLLVTTTKRATSLATVPFADGYVVRVEWMPTSKEDWSKLMPLQKGEARTLVIHPPDPRVEQALDEAMAQVVATLTRLGERVQEEAEEQLEAARQEIAKLPADGKPYLVYTTKNDRFFTTPEASPEQLKALREKVMRYYGVMKRRLQVLLRSRTRTRWKGAQEEGEHLDQNSIVDIAIAKRMPQKVIRPFKTRVEQDELVETVVGILTDVSGSMTWGGGGRYGGGQSKLELARQATLCFAESLDMAKIRFAVWAFSSNEYAWSHEYEKASKADQKLYGRFGALQIETVKAFNDSWRSVCNRLPNMGVDNQANYDADSVQWAARQLLAQKAKRRVLFVKSDGLPATGEPVLQNARQQEQLRNVVKALTAVGIEVVGIGICDSSVSLYYPHHVVVNDASDLPKVTMQQMDYLLLKSGNRR